MIHAYAIEPEVVSTWGSKENYRYFIEKFSIGEPRIFAEYPIFRTWQKKVLKEALRRGAIDIDLQRIAALIQFFESNKKPFVEKLKLSGETWLENAEKTHMEYFFHAILARSNPRKKDYVLLADQISEKGHPLWDIDRQAVVPRKAFEMAKTISPMLRNSSHIVFIDPYFKPHDAKWRKTLQAFLYEASAGRDSCSSLKLEYYVSGDYEKSHSWDFFKINCQKNIPACLAPNTRINFKRWLQKGNGEKLHDRFILTDIGGAGFTMGLDEGNAGESQTIFLLDKKTYQIRWSQYIKSPVFDLEREPIVIDSQVETINTVATS
jgi:hypothetical protein